MELKIRRVVPRDASAIAAIYDPIVRDTSISFEEEPPGAAEMERRILEITRQYPWLVGEMDGQLAGYVYAGPHRARKAYRWCVEVSAYVQPAFRGKGVASRLYRQLFELLRQQGFWNAYAGVTLPNIPSVQLHENVGFRPIGVYPRIGYKLGKWHDVGWWYLELQAPEARNGIPADPGPPAGR